MGARRRISNTSTVPAVHLLCIQGGTLGSATRISPRRARQDKQQRVAQLSAATFRTPRQPVLALAWK